MRMDAQSESPSVRPGRLKSDRVKSELEGAQCDKTRATNTKLMQALGSMVSKLCYERNHEVCELHAVTCIENLLRNKKSAAAAAQLLLTGHAVTGMDGGPCRTR